MLAHHQLTERIMGAAIEVHRSLGPGFLESVYEGAMAIELARVGLGFERQREVPIHYRGHPVGSHRLDLLVEDEIVVELKAVKSLDSVHFMLVRSYLQALGRKHALILIFSAAPLEVRRVISP